MKNKFEKKLARQLTKAKVRFDYESVRIPYILAGNYIPDFVVLTSLGVLYIEAKGYLRPEHKRKMIAVKKQHPEKDIRIVFYAKNKRNTKWAEKHGFQYAVGDIPSSWLS